MTYKEIVKICKMLCLYPNMGILNFRGKTIGFYDVHYLNGEYYYTIQKTPFIKDQLHSYEECLAFLKNNIEKIKQLEIQKKAREYRK